MPTELPVSLTPSNPVPIAFVVHARPPTDRQTFRAPTLDCVLAAVDFTAFTADVAPRRQRVNGN